MERLAVLVIEDGAAEAALVCAALALRPELQVLESPDVRGAIERLAVRPAPVALAIAGARALTESAEELVTRLEALGIPVIGVAASLSPEAKRRALAAGVREIHDRPTDWRPYSELIESLVSRFIRTDSPPHRDPTS